MSNYEIDLIKKAQQGDEMAFNELYEAYYKQAYYFALKITNCDADAQDAVQETFITIRTAIKELREAKNFKKWMLQIVLSKCNKIFRKNKYTVLDPDIVSTLPIEEERTYMSGENHMEDLSRHEWIMEMLSQLTENQREILLLMYFNQLSIKEISEILEIPEGTVKSRLVSAKTALKRKMEQSEDAEQFKIMIPMPLLLFQTMRKDYQKLMNTKLDTSYVSFAKNEPHMAFASLTMIAVIAVGGMLGHQVHQIMQEDFVGNTAAATYTDETGTYTQKEVYYKLREWAHCHVEMEQKTAAEYEVILPYYNFLKEINSPYYIRLQAYNHWAEDFEKNRK